MDSVMINQLPELVISRNRTMVNKTTNSVPTEKRNPYVSKWYVLFDNKNDQWISFQPTVGQKVYPCYACRDMFGSRNSFLDHVNRRGLVLKYRCGLCKKSITFYNTCSFLLHARDHFSEKGGNIDLDQIDISAIPMDIAGFLPIQNVSRLYDVNEDNDNENLSQCVKFFKPTEDCKGQRFVNFKPHDIIFFSSPNENNNAMNYNEAMIIKQINKDIPKCMFVTMNTTNNDIKSETMENSSDNNSDIFNTTYESNSSDIVCLDDEDSSLLIEDTNYNNNNSVVPKIQVRNLTAMLDKQQLNFDDDQSQNAQEIHTCFECKEQVPFMMDHFQQSNRPLIDDFKCKKCGLIATSACSLKAHVRIHDKKSPFVCPECGKCFQIWDELNTHMEFVCFHTGKTVRFKCPAKKCGKIFAQTMTFSSHFPIAHMKVRFACGICQKYFITEIEYAQHATTHETDVEKPSLKIPECTVCLVPAENITEHVLNHVQDKDNRIYVFICRYCRSYYRSKQTFAAHLLKCSKLLLNNQVKKEVQRIDSHNDMKCKVIKFCKPCYSKIQFHCAYKNIKHVASCCPQCFTPFSDGLSFKNRTYHDFEYTSNTFVKKNTENSSFVCIMCNETLERVNDSFNYNNHMCKYKNPIVILDVDYNTDRQINSIGDQQKIVPASTEDTIRKKRKRLFYSSARNKRNSGDRLPDDLLPVEPILFDGEYKCKICNFKNESRKVFHEHIQKHRDVSTSYQCMECGECFVVKPSLLKHLQVFHTIEDVELYMSQNECFDKEAVRMLEENMRMVPGEGTEPVAENQCKICRQHFSESQELSKHFRVHGMAFLMNKIK